MSNVWGGVGAWALDAERADAEERERAAADGASSSAAGSVLGNEPSQSFPSLKEAAATKPRKKKPVTVPLSQFVGSGGGRGESLFEPKGLTPDEMLRLPTGPRERSQDELEPGRLGGGFRSYGGGSRGGFSGRRSDDGESSWSGAGGGRRSYGGFDDEPRRGPPARASDLDLPSRADEVDNWAAGKKSFAPAPMDYGRSDRYSSLGSGGPSRADGVDDWAAGKKILPSRSPSFGSGFRDSRSPSDFDRRGRPGGGPLSNNEERPKLILDPPKGNMGSSSEPVRTRPSPFGAARPRENVLAEKGVDWKKIDSEMESKKTSRPTSSHSSRPNSAQSSRPGSPGSQAAAAGAPKPRPKVNPFGDAKPREVLLQERGEDWKKIDLDLEHRSVDRPETDEEKMLKNDIDRLKALTEETEQNQNGNSAQLSAEDLSSLREQKLIKERDLELLRRQLDDKVRFGQRVASNIRPSSGAGRSDISSPRPPSQSGLSEESRSIDFMDRPRSRGGMGDGWSRPADDRWGFQGGRERSIFDNVDRSKSRERW